MAWTLDERAEGEKTKRLIEPLVVCGWVERGLMKRQRAREKERVAVSVRRQFVPKVQSSTLPTPSSCSPSARLLPWQHSQSLNCTLSGVEAGEGLCVCGGTNTEILGACVYILVCNCFIYCIWVYLSTVSYLSIWSKLQSLIVLQHVLESYCVFFFSGLLTFVVVLKNRFQSQWHNVFLMNWI